MSEVSMNMEDAGSPMQRAVLYLERQQKGHDYVPKATKKGESAIETRIVPKIPEVRRAEPLVKSVTAYEQMIDGFTSEKAKQVFEDLRPVAYKTIDAVQWGARIADVALGAAMFLPNNRMPFKTGENLPMKIMQKNLLTRGATLAGVMRFRPVEWATEQAIKGGLSVTRPIADLILQGGEPKAAQPLPGEAPVAA
jgi:hypothetical protein